MMTTAQWRKVEEIFDAVVDRPLGERAAFLDEVCGDDAELRAEVESLLEHDCIAPPDFMDPPKSLWRGSQTDASDDLDPLIGEYIGGFHIKGVIASGGMGTVYEAVQEEPRRVVALKVMHRNVASRSALRRFQFESQILARLRHPNVAQVFTAGIYNLYRGRDLDQTHPDEQRGEGAVVDDEVTDTQKRGFAVPYFAMEYIPGAKSLIRYANEKELGTRDRLRMFAKVCDAVHHGHQKGIIHRDLKPANILVDSAGEPKVIDFGVARGTDSDLAITTQQTDIGQLIGTMQYMSPEQCDADPHDLDTRSDVYALGVVLYELLTGELPYKATGSTIYQATRIIKDESPRRLSSVNPKLRGDVETIVLTALEKDRDRRYQSAAGMAADIERYQRGEPIAARPPTAWRHVCHFVSRHPIAATSVMCLTIAVLTCAATAVSIWFVNERPDRIVRYRNGVAMEKDDHQPANEARLLTYGGVRSLKTWGSAKGSIALAELVDRPEEFGGGKLALIGYTGSEIGPYRNTLCAYEVPDGLDVPHCQGRMETEDVLLQLREDREYKGDQFWIANTSIIADVFLDSDHPGVEVVAIFSHYNSQRVIRIYDLDGKLLYQVWHDGTIVQAHWMLKAGLLVFAGDNAMLNWDRQGRLLNPELDPVAAFALRPQPGYIGRDWLASEPGNSPSTPVWYKCLRLGKRKAPVTRDDISGISLSRPANRDSGRFLRINVHVNTEASAAVGWCIDELGNEVRGSRNASNKYQVNQLLDDDDPRKLPDPDAFHLGPMPPIESPPAARFHDQSGR